MHKNELEFRKATIAGKKFSIVAQTIRHLSSVGGILFAIWLIFEGLAKVLVGQDADGIAAFARLFEALGLGTILLTMWGGMATVAWWRERSGKQRIIAQKSKLQRQIEADEPNRSSSGLTETGGTPEGEV